MARLLIPADRAIPVRRAVGSTVTFVNQKTVDVYLDSDYNRLNAALPGTAPDGTKLAASGGQVQITNYPGVFFLRSATDTEVEVQP
jgi:hypothetical protein